MGIVRLRTAALFAILLASCKDDRPRELASSSSSESGARVKSRRGTVMNGKVAWGGIVAAEGDRAVKSAFVEVVVRDGAGAEVGRARSAKIELAARYGARIEVNGIAVSGAPAAVEPTLVDVRLEDEPPPAWKPAAIAWEKPLPDGVSFAVVEDAGCGTTLAGKGEPGRFACTVGIRHTGTRTAPPVALRFQPARGGEAIALAPPHPTDLPIEPGDALVFRAAATVKKPSEMILTGTLPGAR